MAFVDRFLSTEREYFMKKVEIELELEDHLKARLRNLDDVTVYLDTLDQQRHNESVMYLTVTGTSAEGADSARSGGAIGSQVFSRLLDLPATKPPRARTPSTTWGMFTISWPDG